MIINCNENDYQYQNVASFATKKCIGAQVIYVYVKLYKNYYEQRQNINITGRCLY